MQKHMTHRIVSGQPMKLRYVKGSVGSTVSPGNVTG